jgi:small-conductance mechanosensitive channel
LSPLHRDSENIDTRARTSPARWALALIVATWLIPASASAQETPKTKDAGTVTDADAKPAPEDLAIPLVEISQRAEQTAQILKAAIDSLPLEESVAEVSEQIPEVEKSLREQRSELDRALVSDPSRERLADFQAEWGQTLAQLEAWREKLGPGILKIESALESLSKEKAVWERTRKEAEGADSPQTITKRIRITLQEIDKTIATVKTRQSALLTLQDQVVQQDLVAKAAVGQIEAAQQEGRSGLFERDAPPLWADLREVQSGEHLDEIRASIARDLESLRKFVAESGSQFLLDLLIFIVVIRYALAVKRRLVNPVEGIPPIGRSGELFERPVAIAVLATVLLMRLVHGPAPIGFSTIISFVLILPLVRLVPLLLPKNIGWVVWVMAALIVISRSRMILSDAPLASELLFGVETIGMIATLLWLMRPSLLREIPANTPVPRLLGIGMRATLLLLSVSILSSALGFRDFASLIGSATTSSVYAAMILYAAAGALQAGVEASFHTAPAQNLSFVRRRRDAVLRITGRYASLVAGIYWVYLTLRWFEIFDWANALARSILAAHLEVGEIQVSLGDVIAFILTVVVAFMLSRLIRFFLEEEAFPRMRLRRGVGNAVSTLLHYIILLLGFVFALSAAGMDFTRVALFAGAFSVGIGFGLQSVVNNFVSGLVLLFERPVQIGDMVEVGALNGEVRRIGARSSTVRTFDGAEVIVPNANLITEPVVNWTLSDRRRRLDLEVGVAYGTDPEVVLALLEGVAEAHDAVLETPQAQALFLEFGDSSLNFRLRVWIPRYEEGFAIRSELTVAINAALRDAGIQIPFPQRDLHVRSVESDVMRSLDGQDRE